MKKIISSILAVTAAMSIATVSYATTPITWSDMYNASIANSSLSSYEWDGDTGGGGVAKYYGTLASGVWARLQEFSNGNGSRIYKATDSMYDVAAGEVTANANGRLSSLCGWDSSDWYGGGIRVKLTDKQVKPGNTYKVTVKAGISAHSSNVGEFTDGTHVYAMFGSTASKYDFRTTGATDALADALKKGAAVDLGAIDKTKQTVDGTDYYKLNTYTGSLTAVSGAFSHDEVYSGMTTLCLIVANKTADGWTYILPSKTMARFVVDSVTLEPADDAAASTVVRRGVSQTFEKIVNGVATADDMGWKNSSGVENTRVGTRATTAQEYGGASISPVGSGFSLLLGNKTGAAVDLSATRAFSSYEIRPGEKYSLSFYARQSLKASNVNLKVTVGDTDVITFADAKSDNYFGALTSGWKQFYCTFTAPEASAYTDGKIDVKITAVSMPGSTSGETDVRIDDVVLTAQNQSFADDFNAAEGEDLVPFYANVYAGSDAINATLYPALFSEGRFIKADTFRPFIVDANAVTTLSDSVSVNGGDTLKLMYWDGMNPVVDFNQMRRPAAAAE